MGSGASGLGAAVGGVLGGPIGAAAGGALLGGIAGGAGSPGSSTSRIDAGTPSSLESAGYRISKTGLGDYRDLVNQGPGSQDVQAGLTSQRDLASLLESYSKNAGIATGQDYQNNLGLARQATQGQQVAINQSLEQSRQGYARQAAISGRSALDPVFMGMLGQERQRAQERLGAQQSELAAFGINQQKLGYTAQLANVRSGLASQAMSNRQALINLGQSAMNSERNFRLGTATRSQDSMQGGGLGGAISGAMAGAGAGLNAYGSGLFNSAPQPFDQGGKFQYSTGSGIARGVNNFGPLPKISY